MTLEIVLPYFVWFAVLIGFLAAVTVGVGMGLILITLQSVMNGMKKFNTNLDFTQDAFEKLQKSMQQQLLSQVRVSEAWHRQRKEQLEEEEEQGGKKEPPPWRKDWSASG